MEEELKILTKEEVDQMMYEHNLFFKTEGKQRGKDAEFFECRVENYDFSNTVFHTGYFMFSEFINCKFQNTLTLSTFSGHIF